MKTPTPAQFEDWSRRLAGSDRQAYTDVFEATYDALYRYAWQYTHDADAAYDVLQDVFLKLWQVRARLDPARSLKALLYQMTRNTALNLLRYRRRHAADALDDALPVPAETPDAPDALDADALERLLRGWIDELPPRRREAFVLSRYVGLSHQEIADAMDLAPKTVNNHIVLALQHLRSRLGTHQPDLSSL
ncbi:MAG: RNA polymerase sigma-70 factor [Rhodothermales bacterium]|nr:RNA polymerase sigma-70 factor [Rhodothermales bacterium]